MTKVQCLVGLKAEQAITSDPAMGVPDFLVPFLITLQFISLVCMLVFNSLGGIGNTDLFPSSVGNVSDKYDVLIVPKSWTFTIWSLIYALLSAGIIYSLTTLFRKIGSVRVYTHPPILSWVFYSLMIINYILNSAWIFVWLNEYLAGASILLLFITYTSWTAIGFACYSGNQAMQNNKNNDKATKKRVRIEFLVQTVLIQNGTAIYATWTTIASLINLNIAFQYAGHYDPEVTSLVCCSILIAIIIGWFILENTILDKYVRYIITQYPVVIFASGGIVDSQMAKSASAGPDSPDPIPESVAVLGWTVLSVASALFLFRLAIVIYRFKFQPLYSGDEPSGLLSRSRK